ncbi:hypothetical protein [Candidatus Nitrosocosmicus sp. T]
MNNRFFTLLPLLAIVLLSSLLILFGSLHTVYSKNLTNPTDDAIRGSITSTTNNGTSADPAWILGGVFKFSNINSTTVSPTFNSTFYMAKVDGTANHTHSIYNFKLAGQPTVDNTINSTLYNGTSTVTMREGPVNNVPTQINILGDHAISIKLDGSVIDNHFGSQPIFGTQHKTLCLSAIYYLDTFDLC